MKNLLLIAFVLFTISSTYAQKAKTSEEGKGYDGSKNTVYVELLGNGLLGSFNYDVRLAGKLGARVGVGFVGDSNDNLITVPVMANILLGKNGRYFEIGAGATYISGTTTNEIFEDSDSNVFGTLSFMYRSQPVDGGFMWKIGLTPLFTKGFFFPYYGGVSLGYAW